MLCKQILTSDSRRCLTTFEPIFGKLVMLRCIGLLCNAAIYFSKIRSSKATPLHNFFWCQVWTKFWVVTKHQLFNHVHRKLLYCLIVSSLQNKFIMFFIRCIRLDMFERFRLGRSFKDDGDLVHFPTCAQCSGVPPFAGKALPECNWRPEAWNVSNLHVENTHFLRWLFFLFLWSDV